MPAGQGQGERGGHSRRLGGVLGSSVLLGLGWALVYLVLATPRLSPPFAPPLLPSAPPPPLPDRPTPLPVLG